MAFKASVASALAAMLLSSSLSCTDYGARERRVLDRYSRVETLPLPPGADDPAADAGADPGVPLPGFANAEADSAEADIPLDEANSDCCKPEAPATRGTCAADSHRCLDGRFEACDSSGQWHTLEECPLGCTDAGCITECTRGDAICSSLSERQVCSEDGSWLPPSACPSGSCIGVRCTECLPGQRRCSAASTLRECDEDGSWISRECDPLDLCKPTPGTENEDDCVSAIVTLGNAQEFSGIGMPPGDVLYYFALEPVDAAYELSSFGLFGSRNGAMVRFALFEDRGGLPGQRVALTESTYVSMGTTQQPPRASMILAKGERYWLGVLFDNAAVVAERTSDAAPLAYSAPCDSDGIFPIESPTTLEPLAREWNVFVVVRELPR